MIAVTRLSCTVVLLLVATGCQVGGDAHGEYRNLTSNLTVIRRVLPFMHGRSVEMSDDNVITCADSVSEFPQLFTPEQRKQGGLLVAIFVAVYCFTTIAIICDSYFLPCVSRICDALNLSQDVAAATFMSIATSAPELFVNIIGTFVTESDIGIGTVVGSSMFNTLGVASLGGLAAATPIQLDWWPLTRDTFIYIMAVMLLVTITWDGKVFWYEGLVLFFVYFVYFTIMFQNARISKFFKDLVRKMQKPKVEPATIKKSVESPNPITFIDVPISVENKFVEQKEESRDGKTDDEEANLFECPSGRWYQKVFFVYTWPLKFLLSCTVPDPMKHKKLYPLTFIMCVIWIGTNSYLVSWMITIIGYTFGIQDSILGLTFLAAGGCLPEAISITIMSRKGEGAMGVSNALGANTMNILLSLGLPWFIKTIILATNESTSSVKIISGSIEYTILALIMVATTLYITLCCNKFRLSRTNGLLMMIFYFVFIILAVVSELYLFPKVKCSDVST